MVEMRWKVNVFFQADDGRRGVQGARGLVEGDKRRAHRSAWHDRELGVAENFRFVTAPLLIPFDEAGSGTLNGCLGSSNVDVYPILVIAEVACANVALKGMGAVKPTILSARQKNHANPLGQFGYVGGDFWMASVRLNENWMVRLEVGATSL